MKGKWERSWQVIGGDELHVAGRLLDTSKIFHGGNYETIGGYCSNAEAVDRLCEYLNELEEKLLEESKRRGA